MAEQNAASGSYNNPYRFNGKEQDAETGLYYYDARYYDPRTGRFISVDPLADKYPGWTPYSYTLNNPVRLVDPTGMSAEDIIDLDKDNNVVNVIKQAGPNIIRNHNGSAIEVNQASKSAQNIKVGDKFANGELYRKVDGLDIYRHEIDIKGSDQYGHWWLEMKHGGKDKSYGWWPKGPVDYIGTLFGVDGELNGVTNFGGSANRDPHHGDRSGDHYAVYSSNSKNGQMSSNTIKNNIINYSKNYSGGWSWPFGQNCHSFQNSLLDSNNLRIFSSSRNIFSPPAGLSRPVPKVF